MYARTAPVTLPSVDSMDRDHPEAAMKNLDTLWLIVFIGMMDATPEAGGG